ncbi:hypothetical protein SEA_LUKER_94 [Gordonia phage Luker]|uniref:Uncharacterized protein n=1 Tax=Gordonia phage Luker TaxID=2591188 RepID=A0A514A4Y7_9CAUD|nr:hypothetical protein SEA_LUKER_94 [Gordonia phage Luker]
MKHNINGHGYGVLRDVKVTARQSVTATRPTPLSANLGNTGAELNQIDANNDEAINKNNWHLGGDPIVSNDPDELARAFYAKRERERMIEDIQDAPVIRTRPVRPAPKKSDSRIARERADRRRARNKARLARRRAA